MYDILIKHGTVVDGTGEVRKITDIAIEKGIIKKIGDIEPREARTVIEAPNLIVTPGFIDGGSHADTYLTLFTNLSQESLLRQGITTIIGGNCGTSLAPLVRPEAILPVEKWASSSDINVNWHSLKEYFSALTKRGLPLNYGTFVGYETLVRGIRPQEGKGPVNTQELRQVCTLLRTALEGGALGLSTGFEFLSKYTLPYEALIPLVKIVREKNALHTIHLRNERSQFLGALNEALLITKETGVRTHIAHLKVHHPHWEWFDTALDMIDHARESGAVITFDMYPYLVSATHLAMFLPDPWRGKNFSQIRTLLRDKETRTTFLAALAEDRYTLRSITIAALEHATNLVGKTIETIAREFDESEEEAFLRILEIGEGNVIGFIPSLSRDNLRRGYSHPASYVASNSAGYDLRTSPRTALVHPRAYGTFPKFFRDFYYTRELLSLEEAIRKMTSTPALTLGLAKRGIIKEGYYADLAIIDPHRFRDTYHFGDEPRYAEGVEHLIINGTPVILKGNLVSRQAGRIITQ